MFELTCADLQIGEIEVEAAAVAAGIGGADPAFAAVIGGADAAAPDPAFAAVIGGADAAAPAAIGPDAPDRFIRFTALGGSLELVGSSISISDISQQQRAAVSTYLSIWTYRGKYLHMAVMDADKQNLRTT
jgi:hypothetical protein